MTILDPASQDWEAGFYCLEEGEHMNNVMNEEILEGRRMLEEFETFSGKPELHARYL